MKNDHDFALRVNGEFGIPLPVLTNVISTLRTWVQIHPEKTKTPSAQRIIYKNREFAKILNSKVTAIHLETSDNVFYLSEADPLFHYFNTSINRMKNAFNREMNDSDRVWNKQINSWAERQTFRYFILYFRNSNVQVFDQKAIIGQFLYHFNINSREQIMSPAEWANDMKGADSWNDYLNSRVKYRYNKFVKEILKR